MRISDWSSDVCSSDLLHLPPCALQAGRNDHAPGRGSPRIRWRNLPRLLGTRPGLVRLLAARQRRVALQAALVSSLSASRQTARLPRQRKNSWRALGPPCRRRPALQEMIEELQPPPGEVELILRAILVRRVARALVLQHHHRLAQATQKIELLPALERNTVVSGKLGPIGV